MKNTKCRGISNCLKMYRRARGLQQKEVAKILGVKSSSMISRWEKGACLPNPQNMFKLAVLYRTMVDALYVDQLRVLKHDLHKREESVLRKRVNKKR